MPNKRRKQALHLRTDSQGVITAASVSSIMTGEAPQTCMGPVPVGPSTSGPFSLHRCRKEDPWPRFPLGHAGQPLGYPDSSWMHACAVDVGLGLDLDLSSCCHRRHVR